MTQTNLHKPVLIDSIASFLNSCWSENYEDRIIFDGTFGGGGYTKRFLNKNATIIASDLDLEAIQKGKITFKTEIKDEKLKLVHTSFLKAISELEDNSLDLAVVDLGFSSNQLEYSKRGFSFQKRDQELDLRFNTTISKPCWQRIKTFKKPEELAKIIYLYSGEPLSNPIARELYSLVRSKKNIEILTVGEVVDTLDEKVMTRLTKKQKIKTLARVWQSLRIWVNNEFQILEKFLDQAVKRLKPGGYLMVVSFQSLEDKIVTKFMRSKARPIETDQFGNKTYDYTILTKKAVVPEESEISENPRSRSALLRILKKVG
jgi:16S rRNA (cytosine1402-N4)-methyltransferase